MTSKISGRTYRVFVFKPPVPPPPEGYPVVMASDGNMTFPILAAMSALLMRARRPAMAVAVGYPTDDMAQLMVLRSRDLTPPTPLEAIRAIPGLPPPTAENFGGSELFFRFLTEELRPALAAAYEVDPNNQSLYGYSLGGLFTLQALFDHPGAFRTFVAASPSIWWNERVILGGEAGFVRQVETKAAAPRVLISIGAEEQTPPTTPPPGMTAEQSDALIREARMVDNARDLGERLAGVRGAPGYLARFHKFEAEDHATAFAGSIARALDFALQP
jgi:predicted alpha/beta superfamily hydrolase